MTFIIDKKLLFYLIITFILMTVIGTLSHEAGHYLAAKILGYDATINYQSMHLLETQKLITRFDRFMIKAGGPIQTILTGTIAFLFLVFSMKKNKELTIGKWFLIFISLLWLRQSANFIVGLGIYFFKGHIPYSDEIGLTYYLNLPFWSIELITALIGFCVLAIIIFNYIPKNIRFTFILSGIIGGVSGFILWFYYFGKYILP